MLIAQDADQKNVPTNKSLIKIKLLVHWEDIPDTKVCGKIVFICCNCNLYALE